MNRPCIVPGCPGLTTTSRCPAHEQEWQAARNARPGRQAYKDPAYRRLRPGLRCERCGSTTDLTKDHVVPLSRGGTNHPSNLRTLCRACNSRKRDR